MRAMIFGDTATGKSTFAENLGVITDTPVIHLDRIMDSVGRDDRLSISDFIHEEADKDSWIIEGNAFTKDPTYRIEKSDLVFVFDFTPINALASHIARHARIKTGREERIGSENEALNLRYFLPYIFKKFPPRKQAALNYAQSLDKEVVIFNQRSQATQYLSRLGSNS